VVEYHTWETNNKKYIAVYDELYQTAGSYAYDTEEEAKKAEDEEIAKLDSGEWIALGVFVYEEKPHCKTCTCTAQEWPLQETDSIWGIVVENSKKAIENYVRDMLL
jgi:hypothetical protein